VSLIFLRLTAGPSATSYDDLESHKTTACQRTDYSDDITVGLLQGHCRTYYQSRIRIWSRKTAFLSFCQNEASDDAAVMADGRGLTEWLTTGISSRCSQTEKFSEQLWMSCLCQECPVAPGSWLKAQIQQMHVCRSCWCSCRQWCHPRWWPVCVWHWLHTERVKYKLATMVYNCLHGKAPSYLTVCCTPISDVASWRHMRSASRRQLLEYSSLDTISPHMVVGLFLSRVRLPGTACATNCENRC